MTTARQLYQPRAGRGGAGNPPLGDDRPARPASAKAGSPRRARGLSRRTRKRGWFARHPAWPITALLAGYPLWWALGLSDYIFVLLAIPMALRLHSWRARGERRERRERRVRVPPGFGMWLLFLVVMLAGAAVLPLTAPQTVASPLSHRAVSFAIRAAEYAAVTAMLLYAGNLTERELPRRRLAWLLGLVAIYAIAGGLGGVLAPGFQFKSPVLLLLPHSLQANSFIQASMQPGLAQIQDVLGTASGRPKAPFDYTNTWGNCLSILLPWLFVGWWRYGTRRHRLVMAVALAVAVAPVVYSLNRGMWIGLGFSVLYILVRMAARGRLAVLGTMCAGLAVAALIVLGTPLHDIISERLAHGHSNLGRASLSAAAVAGAMSSPVIGYGDTRQQRGSPLSITVGPSENCTTCGQTSVGSNGQLWLLLISTGFVGAALYLAFFGYAAWRFRHDTTPYGLAGVLVVLLSFIYMFTYVAVVVPLGFTMLAYAILWRNDSMRLLTGRGTLRARGSGAEGSDAVAATVRQPDNGLRWDHA